MGLDFFLSLTKINEHSELILVTSLFFFSYTATGALTSKYETAARKASWVSIQVGAHWPTTNLT